MVYTDLNPSGILGSDGKPRWIDSWKDPRMVKMIKYHNHVHGEPMIPVISDKDMLVFARGKMGLVVINNKSVLVPLQSPAVILSRFRLSEETIPIGD